MSAPKPQVTAQQMSLLRWLAEIHEDEPRNNRRLLAMPDGVVWQWIATKPTGRLRMTKTWALFLERGWICANDSRNGKGAPGFYRLTKMGRTALAIMDGGK